MAPTLSIANLREGFKGSGSTAAEILQSIYARIESEPADATWISVIPQDVATKSLSVATKVEGAPLFGIPFAVKDNIDVAGSPTTAACPDFAYTPSTSAPVVERLVSAGAIPIGKTNLDQFATGLVGVRSPHGAPRNPFNSDYIPGGSSSGSAVAVAKGLCSFSLGTDTAGSGRVPASFNGLVGLKPTRGLLSTRGVVPACRSLDCVSIFALNCHDAAEVFSVAIGFDALDPFSRHASPPSREIPWPPRIGIPRQDQLKFFGNQEAESLFHEASATWKRLGARIQEIDFAPFLATARLLYEGAWVAERYAAIEGFIEKRPDSLHPVTRQIIEGARKLSAADAFKSAYRLADLRRSSEGTWQQVDCLLTPTAGTVFRTEDVLKEPLQRNSDLGYYTNYMNLLDLCGLAVPFGKFSFGVPFGVTLVAPAFHDDRLLYWGAQFLGEQEPKRCLHSLEVPSVRIAVCGAHLSGLPLNSQLVDRGARLIEATTTSSDYQLFELPGASPRKPGLLRVDKEGAKIAVEIWELPLGRYGDFVAGIPAPLGIGTIRLASGACVQGFLCESAAVQGAKDITQFGGWRSYLGAV